MFFVGWLQDRKVMNPAPSGQDNIWEHNMFFTFHFIFILVVAKSCYQRGWPWWNGTSPGQQMQKKKRLLCNFHYSEARLFCSNRELSLLCTESSSFLPKKKNLGQDNPSLPPLDFAVLAESKHQGLDVLLEDSHESWQLQPAFWRTQITKLCVAGRTFTVSSLLPEL